jgi:hypothetical protein
MAKFEPGNKLSKGRPVGALNRSTEQAKLAVARLANQGLDALREDLEKIRKNDPLEAAKLYLKLLEYIVPKKAQVELSGEIEQRIQQISVNITQSNAGTDRHTNNDNVSEHIG